MSISGSSMMRKLKLKTLIRTWLPELQQRQSRYLDWHPSPRIACPSSPLPYPHSEIPSNACCSLTTQVSNNRDPEKWWLFRRPDSCWKGVRSFLQEGASCEVHVPIGNERCSSISLHRHRYTYSSIKPVQCWDYSNLSSLWSSSYNICCNRQINCQFARYETQGEAFHVHNLVDNASTLWRPKLHSQTGARNQRLVHQSQECEANLLEKHCGFWACKQERRRITCWSVCFQHRSLSLQLASSLKQFELNCLKLLDVLLQMEVIPLSTEVAWMMRHCTFRWMRPSVAASPSIAMKQHVKRKVQTRKTITFTNIDLSSNLEDCSSLLQ